MGKAWVERTRDDDLEFVREVADPLVGFLELLECSVVGHVSGMNEHISVRNMF